MQRRTQLQHGFRKASCLVAAACLLALPSMGLAGTDLGAVARALASNVARPVHGASQSVRRLAAPSAAAMKRSRQPLPLPLDAPRHASLSRAFPLQPAAADSDSVHAFPIAWQKGTEAERVARSLKHNGVPLVHLWGSGRNLLAIGVSPRGVPGIYFTQKLPD